MPDSTTSARLRSRSCRRAAAPSAALAAAAGSIGELQPQAARAAPASSAPSTTGASASAVAVDGCRGRETPPSLRFLGRQVYVAAIVVLIAILRHGATAPRIERLSAGRPGVDRRTIARWRAMVARELHGDAVLADRPRPLHAAGRARSDCRPRSSIASPATSRDQLIALLRFLGPITGRPHDRSYQSHAR